MTLSPMRIAFNRDWIVGQPVGPFAAVMGSRPASRTVTLPHDAMRDMERTVDASSGAGSGYWPSAAWTYRKNFTAPDTWIGAWVALEIDGAAAKSMIYVNGAKVASRKNAYARFIVEIGPYLHYGGENEIRIEVRAHRDSRWYSGAGLFRGVRLIVTGAVHIAADGLRVHTPAVDAELATVEVMVRVSNASQVARTVRVHTALHDASGLDVGREESPVTIPANDTVTLRQHVFLRNPQRWSVDTPTLYSAEVAIDEGGNRLDSQTVNFGLRTVQADPVRGLRINGEPLKLRGACVHHDNGPLGAVSLPRAEERRLQKLKDAGFNAIRTAHNPASQAFLDACDRIGLLVINEAFDMWEHEKSEHDYAWDFTEWWQRDVEAMVNGSFNHPSVIMYSIGNEIIELGTAAGAVMNRRTAEHVRACDATRLITNGINTFLMVDAGSLIESGGLNELMGGDASNIFGVIAASDEVSAAVEEIATPLDVVGYNYAESRYDIDAASNPHRMSLGSETFPTAIAANWRHVMQHPQVLGDFTWTGWDYLGEAGIGAPAYAEDVGIAPTFAREFPFRAAYCGDFDITGFRRPASYFREIAFGLRSEPYIAVQRPNRFDHTPLLMNAWRWSDAVASWTWLGHEGDPVLVEVYANADEVELLLDGSSVARSVVGASRELVAEFRLTYRPGTLVAIAYRLGQEVGRSSLATATSLALQMQVDRHHIAADAEDLAYVDISLSGASGASVCGADLQVAISVTGPGELAGMASGNPKSNERFDATMHKTFDGRALAIVRALAVGVITVTASAPGHEPVSITINGN